MGHVAGLDDLSQLGHVLVEQLADFFGGAVGDQGAGAVERGQQVLEAFFDLDLAQLALALIFLVAAEIEVLELAAAPNGVLADVAFEQQRPAARRRAPGSCRAARR